MTEDLFDWDEGRRGKKEGMARAEGHADPAWKQAAEQAVIDAARTLPTLTADDVMRRIPPEVSTHEKRALGPVMMRAAKQRWIEKSSLPPVNCTRPNCHAAPITVWKSLLYEGGA